MSFRDFMHEKAEESRHNETVAYLIFLAGAVFFVGGIIESLSLGGEPNWLLIFPYYTEAYPGALLGLAMTISGFILMIFGVGSGLYFSRDRSWYLNELCKSNSTEVIAADRKNIKTIRKKKPA
jgi:hypothetical protein